MKQNDALRPNKTAVLLGTSPSRRNRECAVTRVVRTQVQKYVESFFSREYDLYSGPMKRPTPFDIH